MQQDRRESLIAIGLYLAMLLGNVIMFTTVPYLSVPHYGFGYHAFQIMLCYSGIGTLLMLPWVFKQGTHKLKTTQWKRYWLRAILEFVAFCLSFYSLRYLALPQHTALNFLSPLLGALVVIAVLKEKGHTHTWIALALGFIGMLMITRPGIIPFNAGVIYVLGAAIGFSVCGVIIKLLTASEPPKRIAFYMLSLTTVMALPFGLYHWKAPTAEGWFFLCVIGLIGYMQQICVAKAIAKVPLMMLLPLNFIQLIFTSTLSYLIYAKAIDHWTFMGALVILAATIYNGWQSTLHAAALRKEAKGR